MEFNPNNPIVKLCLQGMSMEDKGQPGEASALFMQAWNVATDDFEKFLAAHYVARHQNNIPDQLKWLETTLQLALKLNNHAVRGAFPALYSNIAKCYEDLGDLDNAKKNYELSISFTDNPTDQGPFYHGTKADLKVGDLLTAGLESNYQPELMMNHIYFTALANGAGLAAALAKGMDVNVFISLNPLGALKMTRMSPTKNFRAIRHALIAPMTF
jgi:rifampin ADP-ribosylating transferase